MFGFFTRLMSIGVFGLAMGILLGSGWIGTTCLDEWQIGVLVITTGFLLFFSGSGKYSMDYYFIKNGYSLTSKTWFRWLGFGDIPISNKLYPKIILAGSILILGITLMTNQVFHGGLWGTLHNKSLKPKLEITEVYIEDNVLSFDVFRTEGVDVYGSWVIGISLHDESRNSIFQLNQEDLASLK